MMRRLDTREPGFDQQIDAITRIDEREDPELSAQVAAIIADVRARGDAALLEYTARFDRYAVRTGSELEIPAAELAAAHASLAAADKAALALAASRIRDYHDRQTTPDFTWQDAYGNALGQRWTPLDRVGVYVPGGRAAYPSSVLMTVVPARCAGVGEVILVVPTPDGVRNPLVLAAAHIAGVDRVFTVGGAQAVASLAYGTETVPAVDKIVGPGNAYVAAAKRQVFGHVGIDAIAGPSEILVIADASAPVDWIAMDLFSQAEHDAMAQSLLISADAAVLDAVDAAIARLLPARPRAATIEASLSARGALIRVRDVAEAAAVANRIAAEHVQLMVRDPHALLPLVRHAGAIFLGASTGEVLGDYVAGPSHVLPTYGTARFSSPLSVYDFRKRSSVIELSREGLLALAPTAVSLAMSEGLEAHGAAAAIRLAGVNETASD
ncbi:MAG: histidinol dehydrogenase [Pseudomonadales bacterium]|nr:histidinol dehydrogenase [Pseudomonadales bacterium]MCP5185372.1 histidinol dehydrogenase [Pseudomonadales bacterium]